MHDSNCFLTLTYDDEHLPEDRSLNKKHFQDFMKRLRKQTGEKIRYYHCGEYGEEYYRPHYHALLFGFDPVDKVLIRDGEYKLYESPIVGSVWKLGFHTIGELTFESAAYVSRYCTKKITGPAADEYYRYVDPDTGQVYQLQPEYATMSRKPGIGRGWLDKWIDDVYPSDEVIVRGKPCKPPRYYDNVCKEAMPDLFDALKEDRVDRAKLREDDNVPERLRVKEKVCRARLKQYSRKL